MAEADYRLLTDATGQRIAVALEAFQAVPYVATIPTGQWSGSGNDRYITVQASNVTANSLLIPHYDSASEALLNGPIWCVPAAGSFTIHTSAIPAGTVTVMVQLLGTLGEAQYQVLADVYSTSQVDSIVQQSTATLSYDRYQNSNQMCVIKVGKLCFITCVINSWYNSAAGGTIRSGSATGAEWIISSGFRPIQQCEIKEANYGKRITIGTDGKVSCNEALNGESLRFSGCYICTT